MAGCRFLLQCSISFLVALTISQTCRSQVLPPFSGCFLSQCCEKPQAMTTKVYSLAELGDDPNLCKWIAETIPQMIQPASWTGTDRKINYYQPGKVMVINQTASVHAQIDGFLQDLRKSLPKQTAARPMNDPKLLPAQFNVPDNTRPMPPMSASQAYPVPYPPQAPKHLFHFIIRYEGAGLVDSNVVKFAKALSAANSSEGIKEAGSYLRHAPQYLPPTSDPVVPMTNPPLIGVGPNPFPPQSPKISPNPGTQPSPTPQKMPPADAPAPGQLPKDLTPPSPPPPFPMAPPAPGVSARP